MEGFTTSLGPHMIAKTLSLLLPVLLPSWRFFKTVAASPRIEVRVGQGAWQEVRPIPERVSIVRMARRLIWNPRRNEQLYMVSLSERLAEHDGNHARSELIRLVRAGLPEETGAFEFRLVFLQREGDQIVKFIDYESPVLSTREGGT